MTLYILSVLCYYQYDSHHRSNEAPNNSLFYAEPTTEYRDAIALPTTFPTIHHYVYNNSIIKAYNAVVP